MLGTVAAILAVMAIAFWLAGRGRASEPYWVSWGVGHLLLAAALVLFMLEDRLPILLAGLLPNGLLVLGFGLRWQAARQFAERPAHAAVVWGLSALFTAACLLPAISGSFGLVFTLTNILLAALAGLTAWEFWRDRADGLSSRDGLTFAYLIIAISFAIRVTQGLFAGEYMEQFLPLDTMLTLHLFIAVVHSAMSGAFAIALAFERSGEKLRRMAMHDTLTGLLNRGAFETMLREALDTRPDRPFTVAVLDIDHFKAINDSHGHGAGDAAIRESAGALASAVAAGDLVARIGGEEFAVALWDVGHFEAAQAVDRLRCAIEDLDIAFEEVTLKVTISAGYCHSDDGVTDFDAMMRIADAGLYRAKHEGRNRVACVAA